MSVHLPSINNRMKSVFFHAGIEQSCKVIITDFEIFLQAKDLMNLS